MDRQWAEIEQGLKRLLKGEEMVNIGTVIGVNKEDWTCHVKMANGSEIDDVHLKAFKEQTGGAVNIPVIGTDVILLNIIRPDWMVIAIEEIEETVLIAETELKVEAGGAKLLMNKDGIVLNDGSNKGIPISGKIDTNLNKIKNYVKQLEVEVGTLVAAVEGLTGQTPIMTTKFKSSMATVNMNFENMENNKAKH